MNIRIALLLRRIGPYHHARFDHAGQDLDLHIVETRPDSEEYPWDNRIAVHNSPTLAGNREPNPNYHQYRLPIPPNPERGWRALRLKKEINKVLNKINPDVIVTTGWADAEYHAAVLWAKTRAVPSVVISDSTEYDIPRNRFLEWIKKRILNNYSAALVAGTRSRQYIEKLGFASDKIYAPWDVVDNEYFKMQSLKLRDELECHKRYPLPEKYFLCVSRFVKKKNIPGMLYAYADYLADSIENVSASMVILGSGELQNKIDNVIRETGIDEKVTKYGFIQYDTIPYFYAKASALILPSFSDQWGLVVNEAMACGLPVLISENCGCADDLIKQGQNGLIFNPFDRRSMTKAMLELNNSIRRKTCIDVNKRILDNFNLIDFSNALKESVGEKNIASGLNDNRLNRIFSELLLLR